MQLRITKPIAYFYGVLTLVTIVIGIVLFIFVFDKHIDDTNGVDDTSLNTLDELNEPVQLGSYNYTSYLRKESKTDTYSRVEARKISGFILLRTISTFGDSTALTITSDLEKGNCEIVIVDPSGNILYQVDDYNGTNFTSLNTQGINQVYVVMGVESARIDVTVTEK